MIEIAFIDPTSLDTKKKKISFEFHDVKIVSTLNVPKNPFISNFHSEELTYPNINDQSSSV